MRLVGTKAMGIRLPIISKGDNLPKIVADSIVQMIEQENIKLKDSDIIGITEAIVAKAQSNYATIQDIANDVRNKFPDGKVGVIFPILSRNRFSNILKGIALGAKEVHVVLQFPQDEVGNPLISKDASFSVDNTLKPANEFCKPTENRKHPFTGIDYISLYEQIADNIKVYVSNDPASIYEVTNDVIIAEIHNRFRTKEILSYHSPYGNGSTTYMLSDILSEPINGSGYNPQYGVLGSNLSDDNTLKLFPRDCDKFVLQVQDEIFKKTGVMIEVLVYGDGAFKDPMAGIWELADPVVSPGCTPRLNQYPNEIKLKYVADTILKDLSEAEQQASLKKIIQDKKVNNTYNEGTTPRKYSDLIGSLCDLMSGSGDKGTPCILIQGYFDDYSSM